MNARLVAALRSLGDRTVSGGAPKTHEELRIMGFCERLWHVGGRQYYEITPAGREKLAELAEMEKMK